MSDITASFIKFSETIKKCYLDIDISDEFREFIKSMKEQVGNISKVYDSTIIMQDQKRFKEILSPLSKQLQDSMKVVQGFENTFVISDNLIQFSNALDASYKELQKTWQKYDFEKMFKIIQHTISAYDNDTPFDADAITDEVVETYIADTIEATETDENIGGENRKEHIENIRDWVSFVIGIISLMISIYSVVSTKPTNTYNTVVEVKNYYVNELKINAEILNAMSYRIVTRNDVIPRIKPDCSSRVVGHLNIGQIVVVNNKYKKWVKIDWEDENGNQYSGWIQNYKLTKFK